MEQHLTKRHLLEALKEAATKYPDLNIGASHISLDKYEKRGIIPLGNKMSVGRNNWRVYSESDIKEIVARVIDYKRKQVK